MKQQTPQREGEGVPAAAPHLHCLLPQWRPLWQRGEVQGDPRMDLAGGAGVGAAGAEAGAAAPAAAAVPDGSAAGAADAPAAAVAVALNEPQEEPDMGLLHNPGLVTLCLYATSGQQEVELSWRLT